MSGVNRIAIDSNDAQVTSFISQVLTAGKFTVAPAAELQAWKQWRAERQAMEELATHQATATKISSADLVKEYNANAVKANTSYSRKTLRTSGTVGAIQTSSDGSYFVRLSVGNDSVDVFFLNSELKKVADVKKGQTITIIGRCVGTKLPEMRETAEILRILGGGNHVYIDGATFPVEGLKDYPGTVDAVVTVKKDSVTKDDSESRKSSEIVKDKDGNPAKDSNGKFITREITITSYFRSVTVNIGYQVVRARDSSSIGSGSQTASTKSSGVTDRSLVPLASALEAKIINGPLTAFANEMVPLRKTMNITLAKDDSQDKEAKNQMSEAEKLVKAKDYKTAAASYGKTYAQYGNFAAGYNHALLTEATAGTAAAVELMEALSKKTNNPTAQSMLREMQKRNADNRKAAGQTAAK
jgi:hypothetical protein